MSSEEKKSTPFLILCLEALGVVYGDIGTSPLYTIKVCFSKEMGVSVNETNVYGILSLIFWALTLTVSIKYIYFILQADNKGEGGVLALMSLCSKIKGGTKIVIILGLFGAGLLYGDGVITPAISVLSAVEGLEVHAKALSSYVVPLTVLILVLLFLFQKKGTGRVGKVFGPIMVIWFVSIGALGLTKVLKNFSVLKAINPYFIVSFFKNNGSISSFFVLGAIFLAVTGAEALYADIGHFGKKPIRFNWFTLVFTSLILNYFGQGALLLENPQAFENPFYNLVPQNILIPFVILATMATVIASQAVISGAFSLTRQAVQMGFLPRMRIIHTSEKEKGKIYVPLINYILMFVTILLVIFFKNSENLASAYGVSVTTTMLITTLLFYRLTTYVWNWNHFYTFFITSIFLTVDLSFFSANIIKIERGGYIPLIIGISVFFLMKTWKKGRDLLFAKIKGSTLDWEKLINSIENSDVKIIKGTAVFLSGNPKGVPVAFLHNIKHNKVIHEKIITITIVTTDEPRTKKDEKIELREIYQNPHIYNVIAKYGFMEIPNVPQILDLLQSKGLTVEKDKVSYFLGRETLVSGRGKELKKFEKVLFEFLSRNSLSATTFFGLPANRVVELGSVIEI